MHQAHMLRAAEYSLREGNAGRYRPTNGRHAVGIPHSERYCLRLLSGRRRLGRLGSEDQLLAEIGAPVRSEADRTAAAGLFRVESFKADPVHETVSSLLR